MDKKTILFLYTELAAYTLSCLRELSDRGIEVHVVRYPINKEAPFTFEDLERIHFYDRKKYDWNSLNDLIEKIDPNLICCSGWIDKDYLAVCKKHSKRIITVLALDNKWIGSMKQFLASIAGKFTIAKYFKYAWVSGEKQSLYATKLGFTKSNIFTGFYSCDQNYFQSLYLNLKKEKEQHFPHRFIFVGRYYDFKGIKELWQAFIELKAENKNDWELWCLGTGDVKPIEHHSIKHFGFVQPKEMDRFLKDTGVFIMPSKIEPWGVALHEFSSAGFPVIVSDEVGAGEMFLKENENGFIFHSGNIKELKAAMKKMIALSDEKLMKMGEESNVLSQSITTDTWADSLYKMMNSN